MSNHENKNCSELLLTNGMGLDGAPVKFSTFQISPLKVRPPSVAACGILWQSAKVCCSLLQSVAVCGSLWQSVAVCGSMWQPFSSLWQCLIFSGSLW